MAKQPGSDWGSITSFGGKVSSVFKGAGSGGARVRNITTGKEKAIARVSNTYDSNTKGLGLTKGSNKSYAKANPTVKKAGRTLDQEAAAKAKAMSVKVPVKRL